MTAPTCAATDVAPWLAGGPVIDLAPALASVALPSRRFPGTPPSRDADAAWNTYLAHARRKCNFVSKEDGHREAGERVQHGLRDGSLLSDVILLAAQTIFEKDLKRADGSPFIDFLVASKGLPHALAVLLEMEKSCRLHSMMGDVYLSESGGRRFSLGLGVFCATELAVRAHLAVADADTYAQCVQMIRRALPTLEACRQPLLGVLLPDVPDLSDELALLPDVLADDQSAAWLRLTATAPASLAALAGLKAREGYWHQMYHGDPGAVASLVRERGVDAVALLEDGAAIPAAGRALACIGTPASMRAMALACDVNKDAVVRFSKAAQRWPLAAIAALSELIALDGAGPASARTALAALAHAHAQSLAAFAPWISAGAARVLAEIGTGTTAPAPADSTDTSGLPPVLACPPWKAAPKKAAAPLLLEPLALAPVERWSAAERAAMIHLPVPGYAPADILKDPVLAAKHLGIQKPPYTRQAASAITNADAAALMAAWRATEGTGGGMNSWVLASLPEPMNEEVWNALDGFEMRDPGHVVGTLGVRGLPGLAAMCERRPAQELRHAAHIGAVELAVPVARACATLKAGAARTGARDWLLAYPEHAACALIAPALGKPGAARDQARAALLLLATAGHVPLLMRVAARYPQKGVEAALHALLDADPLDHYPAKIARLPDFWQPQTWTRPQLASGGQALPAASLEHIGIMLRFPHADGVYAGVTQLKQACTSASLAAFAWDAFRAWTDAGSESRESWAFTALGLLGDDDSARKLAPLIRAWPGQGQHARAVTGLEVLARIGSDTALVLLNGVAQRVRFKALQDRARDKIADLAEARGLSAEELEDRLAPDLGLDAQGTLLLDFGARTFLVGFDEALKPCVRGADGKRLPDLPKPNQGDDAALAGAAVARFKLLKKDARTIAAQQVRRLEMAMCTRRRWDAGVFHTFLAGHPLLRHLVRRIVWGAYEADGGGLLACFRVAPDGALTDAADDAFALPSGAAIGIPHALELPASDAAAFGALLADYELTQPFAQIGRDTHTLDQAEQAAERLLRWNGTLVPTARVLGLAERGWRRGTPQDGGAIHDFFKFVAPQRIVVLRLDPGIFAGAADIAPEQTLRELETGAGDKWGSVDHPEPMSTLDPIAASELIRDVEALWA